MACNKRSWNGFAIATPEARPLAVVIKVGRWGEDGGSYEGMNDRDITKVERNAGVQKDELDNLGEQGTVRCAARRLMCSRHRDIHILMQCWILVVQSEYRLASVIMTIDKMRAAGTTACQ
jgi:hypothetical protein